MGLRRPCILLSLSAIALASTVAILPAQEMRGIKVEGYVTAVNSPAEFEVNGEKVELQPTTTWGLPDAKNTNTNSPLRDHLNVGAYVYVHGSGDHHVTQAETVYVRPDWDRKLQGVGPVDKVLSSGAEPVFRADGYPIRMAASTRIGFHGDVTKLADVVPGTWIHYEARRGSDGVLQASKADFFRVQPKPVKGVNGVEDVKLQYEAPDMAAHKGGRAYLGGPKRKWYTIPADPALQDRVSRIGMSLVPQYQRELASDDPVKVNFHFYAFDDAKLHNLVISPRGGLILIPAHLLQRFSNDNELAAVLADAVAAVVQRQGMSSVMAQKSVLGQEAGSAAAVALMPFGVGVLLDAIGDLPDKKIGTMLAEQRARVALGLMADAGYDPWQAPQAFRLLAPKEMPQDTASLRYPAISGYLLGILNLQYKHAPSTAQAANSRGNST